MMPKAFVVLDCAIELRDNWDTPHVEATWSWWNRFLVPASKNFINLKRSSLLIPENSESMTITKYFALLSSITG